MGHPTTTLPEGKAVLKAEATAPGAAQTNRLAREKSPYLLQHQHNPVDWYACGEEAFAKARERAALPITEEGKVVFHSLRHTGISRLANHPAIPLVHVRDFARHKDLVTTQGYVHKIDSPTVTAAIAPPTVANTNASLSSGS